VYVNKFNFVVILALVTIIFGTLSTSCAADPRINLQALLAKQVPVLLEFGRGWCIPCKYMKPVLEDTAKVFNGRVIVTTVDMDANKDLVRDFRIRAMPTQVFLMPDGKEFFRNEGTLEREQIAQIFAKMGVGALPAQSAAPAEPASIVVPQAPPVRPGAAR
jgi:thioredoxin 1